MPEKNVKIKTQFGQWNTKKERSIKGFSITHSFNQQNLDF